MDDAGILGATGLPAVEVGGHGVDALLVHVILVDFHRVPVVEVVPAVVGVEAPHVPVVYHARCVHDSWVYSDVGVLGLSETLRFAALIAMDDAGVDPFCSDPR